MSLIAKILTATLFASAVSLGCGPGEQARTVTNSDSTTTNASGTTQTTTQDTQVLSKDGSKDTTHQEETKQQPSK
jgi:hypothetical protein